MTTCRICGKDDGHHHDQAVCDGGHDEFFICSKCYPVISPIIEVRIEQLARLQRRRESASADNLKKGDW